MSSRKIGVIIGVICVFLLLGVAGVFLLSQSNNPSPVENNEIKEIEIIYSYNDGPLPPQEEYYGDYEVELVITEVGAYVRTIETNGIDERINKKDLDKEEAKKQAEELIEIIEKKEIKNQSIPENNCDGGNSENIIIKLDSKEFFKGHLHNCGGKSSGSMTGNTRSFAEKMEELGFRK
jgi:hypothetical protein